MRLPLERVGRRRRNFQPLASGRPAIFGVSLKDLTRGPTVASWKGGRPQVGSIARAKATALKRGRAIGVATKLAGNITWLPTGCKIAGEGDLFPAVHPTQSKLEAEGLSIRARKRPLLPARPNALALSLAHRRGPARMLNIIRRRWPALTVIQCPTRCRANDAPPKIVQAWPRPIHCASDVIIVTRGGGSIEDFVGVQRRTGRARH